MKKVFIVSKYVGSKSLFLLKTKSTYFWPEEILKATQFKDEETAKEAILNRPENTIGKLFIVQVYYTDDEIMNKVFKV